MPALRFPALVARCNQHVAAPQGEQTAGDALDVLGVVVDQQPAQGGPFGEVFKDLPGDLGHAALLGQALSELFPQLLAKVHQRRVDVLGRLAVQPEDDVVIFLESVRVLQRDLRLADTAGAFDIWLLQDHGPATRPQRLRSCRQEAVAAGEVGVTGGNPLDPAAAIAGEAHATCDRVLLRRPVPTEPFDQAIRRSVLRQVAQRDDGHAVEHALRHLSIGDVDEVLGIAEVLDPRTRLAGAGVALGILEPGEVEVRQDPHHPGGLSAVGGSAGLLADQASGVTGAGEHGGNPLRPELVLRAEIDHDLGPAHRRRPREHPPGAQPQPFLPRRQLGDLVSR